MPQFISQAVSICDYANAAGCFGVIAVAAVFLWPLFSERRAVLWIQCIGASAFSLHFGFIGAGTAAATSIVVLVQLLSATIAQRYWHLWLIYGASIVILVFTSAVTWRGAPSMFAMIASLLATAARLQHSTARMKAGFLISAPFWAIHNIMVGSVFGLIVDVVSTATLVGALCRIGLRIKRKRREPGTTQINPAIAGQKNAYMPYTHPALASTNDRRNRLMALWMERRASRWVCAACPRPIGAFPRIGEGCASLGARLRDGRPYL